MTTPARYRALQWFADHEEADGKTDMLFVKPPTAKMRRLMATDGLVIRLPLQHFGHEGWLLTPKGREVLANRKRRRGRKHDQAEVAAHQR